MDLMYLLARDVQVYDTMCRLTNAVKGELQLRCDRSCGDEAKERGLVPMHHAVVNKWRLGVEALEEFGRSHERSTWCTVRVRVYVWRDGDEDGINQVKE